MYTVTKQLPYRVTNKTGEKKIEVHTKDYADGVALLLNSGMDFELLQTLHNRCVKNYRDHGRQQQYEEKSFASHIASANLTSLTLDDFVDFDYVSNRETSPITVQFASNIVYDFNKPFADTPYTHEGTTYLSFLPIDPRVASLIETWMNYGYWLWDGNPGSELAKPSKQHMVFDENSDVTFPGSKILKKPCQYDTEEDD